MHDEEAVLVGGAAGGKRQTARLVILAFEKRHHGLEGIRGSAQSLNF
jgi:hypothetical protein